MLLIIFIGKPLLCHSSQCNHCLLQHQKRKKILRMGSFINDVTQIWTFTSRCTTTSGGKITIITWMMRNGLAQQDVQESHRLLTRFCIKKNSQSQIILKGSIVLFLSTKFCSVRNELSLRIFFDVTFFDAESDGECVGSCQHWWNFCCSIVWSGFCCYGKK